MGESDIKEGIQGFWSSKDISVVIMQGGDCQCYLVPWSQECHIYCNAGVVTHRAGAFSETQWRCLIRFHVQYNSFFILLIYTNSDIKAKQK